MTAFAPVPRPRRPVASPGLFEVVGNDTALVKGTVPPETVVAPLKAGRCVEAEKSGFAEMPSGFRTLQEEISGVSIPIKRSHLLVNHVDDAIGYK